ncbi:transglycosylase [Paecilomyces lecythidis]|uniref:Crh-like protein n=1 Tax=Paecilomyces lecythidis TaxID=3004212 RepID=A0ABR3XB61_9EURO
MSPYSKFAAFAVAALLPFASAQTYSKCNPIEKSGCPSDAGLNTTTFSTDFTSISGTSFPGWSTTAGTVTGSKNGAEFTINKRGDAPTIQTDFYILFGQIDVKMKSAPGTGIVSSIVLESDDLDEIDWEALGGDNSQIQTDYFGKGDTSTYDRSTDVAVTTPQSVAHTYSVHWTSSSIEWLIDGKNVRTLQYADAKGGSRFPQTPSRVKIGIWAGGDPSNGQGTIEWAGGETDYTKAPFTMYVESVDITNYTPASEYSYDGTSGSWQSIKASNTTSSNDIGDTTSGDESSSNKGSSSSSTTSSKSSSASSSSSSSSSGSSSSGSSSSSSASSSGAASSGSASSTGGSSGSSSKSSSGGASSTAAGSGATAQAASSGASPSSSASTTDSAGMSVKPGIGFGSFMGLIGFFCASVILV